MRPMWPKTEGSYHAKTYKQDPSKGLLRQVTANLSCASYRKTQCYGTGMQAMQDQKRPLTGGWVGWLKFALLRLKV